MSDLERRLEELFMGESHSRRIDQVHVASRRRSPLFIGVAAAGAVAIAVVAGLALGSLRDSRQDAAASPSPRAGIGVVSPSPTSAASPSATPGSGIQYVSDLGYSVGLPEAGTGIRWRRSDLQSQTGPIAGGDTELIALDVFTDRTFEQEQRELASDPIGGTGRPPSQFYTAAVRIDRNSRRLDPRAFAEREKGAYGFEAVSMEDLTFAGRPAAKTTWVVGAGDRRNFYSYYVSDDSGRMWTVGFFLSYPIQEPPHNTREADLRFIVDSFRFTAAAGASPSPATGTVPQEDFGVVVARAGNEGETILQIRGEQQPSAFASLGAVGLTSSNGLAGAASPDGRRFAFWQPVEGRRPGQSKRLLLWDAADPTKTTVLLEAPANEYGDGLVWSDDGQGLLLSFTSQARQPGTPIRPQYGAIRLYDLGTRAVVREVRRDAALTPLAWDRAAGRIAFAHLSGGTPTRYRVEDVRDTDNVVDVALSDVVGISGSPTADWIVATVPLAQQGGSRSYKLRAWPRETPDRARELTAQASSSISAWDWRPGSDGLLVGDHSADRPGQGSVVSIWAPGIDLRRQLEADRIAHRPGVFRADGSAVYLPVLPDERAIPYDYLLYDLSSGRRSQLPPGDAEFIAGVRLR